MKKSLLLAMAVVCVIVAQGCATGLSSNQYTVDVLSKQPNEKFQIINRKGKYIHQGVTPMVVVLKSQSEFFEPEIYKIKRAGKKPTTLTATLTPIYWGNFLGFIGFAVDGITGSMWALPSKIDLDKGENKNDVLDRL